MILYPSADGDRVEWGLVLPTGQPHWWAAGTTDFTGQISGGSGAYGDTDLYTFDTVPSTVVITRLRVHMLGHWRSDSFGNAIFELVMRQGGVDTLCGEVTMLAGPTNFNEEFVWDFDYDPTQVGSVAWTPDRVNSGQFGFALHSAPDDISNTAFEAVYIEILSPQDLYLFGSSTSAGHTNVFQRDGVGTWYLLASANPDNLWFEAASTDYASMLPNGYSVDGNLYSYNTSFFGDPDDNRMNRFNVTSRQIEAGIDKDPGQLWSRVEFSGLWEQDISGGVVWQQTTNDVQRYAFHWDGSSPYYTSPQSSSSDRWDFYTGTVTDYTTMPKDLIQNSVPTAPWMNASGLYLFRHGGYYWGTSVLAMRNSVGNTYRGIAVVRFESAGTPPDDPTEVGIASLQAVFAPIFPTLTQTSSEIIDILNPSQVLRWGAHVWIQMFMQSHYRTTAVGTPVVAAANTTCLALLTDTGDILPAMDFPSVLTYKYGAQVFYHKETETIYSWVISGATYGYDNTTRLSLFRLGTYDISTGTFSWVALAELDVIDAGLFIGPVSDADALYFGHGYLTDQAVYRYDITAGTWATESVIGLTGDEWLTTLVKLAGTVPVSIARFSFGTIIG